MRKSTVFISAVLTTFALVMLYGVVSAYRSIAEVTVATVNPTQNTEVSFQEPTLVPTATPSAITPEEAAQLAAQVVGNTNLLSAESSTFNGLNAYMVTFTNKDVVYVGLDGQVLAVQVAPVYVSVAPAKTTKQKNNNDGGGGGASQEDHKDDEHDD